jgi:hypothetical protein
MMIDYRSLAPEHRNTLRLSWSVRARPRDAT